MLIQIKEYPLIVSPLFEVMETIKHLLEPAECHRKWAGVTGTRGSAKPA